MLKVLGLAALMAVVPMTAEASMFVWKDKTLGIGFSFPDTWTIQTQDVPGTVIRVAAPIGDDAATCRIRSAQDGRVQIYPKDLMGTAMRGKLDHAFWDHEVAQYSNGAVADYATTQKPGAIDVSAVHVSYTEESGNGPRQMSGSMIATIYGGTRYVISCAAKQEEYEKYVETFASIMESVELDAKYHPFATGYYRNFLGDPPLLLLPSKPGTVVPKNKYWIKSGF